MNPFEPLIVATCCPLGGFYSSINFAKCVSKLRCSAWGPFEHLQISNAASILGPLVNVVKDYWWPYKQQQTKNKNIKKPN